MSDNMNDKNENIDETMAKMYGMPQGVYVYKIMEDSAAAGSDLHEKDIIRLTHQHEVGAYLAVCRSVELYSLRDA